MGLNQEIKQPQNAKQVNRLMQWFNNINVSKDDEVINVSIKKGD